MPSEEGPAQKIQKQSQDLVTVGDVVDLRDIGMLSSADKDQPLFDAQQSVRSCINGLKFLYYMYIIMPGCY